MKKLLIFIILCSISVLLCLCRKAEPFPDNGYDDRLSGGANTIFDATSRAFSNPFPGLSDHDLKVHVTGDIAFGQTFVASPSVIHPGLGPIYNNVSCTSCHHNDGIGLPTTGDPQSSLLLRISMAGTDDHGGPLGVPGYGTQLQDKAIYGSKPECGINITYTNQSFSFPDGETYRLRTPTYTMVNTYLPIGEPYMLSPRLAPPVFGLGLLEAIPETDILANADPNDINGDGISGRPNYVWDPITKSMQLGRFGLKANTASVASQVAGALNADMGITTSILPQESCFGQSQYIHYGDGVDLPDSTLHAITFYVQSLSVPARRDVNDPQVKRGEVIFKAAKCESCHKQTMYTGINVSFPQLSNQRLHPYTDLLLHDMGSGLADNRPDYAANGNEWRTAPLWGLGLFATVNYPACYLHDGRAQSLIEAVMWHGGEAQQSKDYVQKLSKADRDALVKFLQSL